MPVPGVMSHPSGATHKFKRKTMNILKIRPSKVKKILAETSLEDLEKITNSDYSDDRLVHIVGDLLIYCTSRPTLTEAELKYILETIHSLFLMEILRKKGFIEYTLYRRNFKVTILNYEKMKDIIIPKALA